MTYNLAPKNAPWFEHLTDSVRGLGEAAREWQLADRAAALAEAHVELERSTLHEGKVRHQPGPDTPPFYRSTRTRTPHADAFFTLHRIYMEHRFRTRREYGHAALLFASGGAWAIRQVQAGEQPDRVAFELDGYEQPAPMPHRYKVEGVDNYVHARKIAEAYDRLLSMEMAAEHAEEIAGRDDRDVTERDASDMFDAADAARGLEDAAYAYGLLAEQALMYVLLGPKDAHRKQLAEQRVAQAQAGTEDPCHPCGCPKRFERHADGCPTLAAEGETT
ncbi:hypothetical protein ABZ890_12110 [Streptomyces sp. NPDC046984]|uniref:hypothetical protein n=1 Tax=Streptomyces sp. NPDC046984 TaxID=3155138 RepID=UPI0033E2B3B4